MTTDISVKLLTVAVSLLALALAWQPASGNVDPAPRASDTQTVPEAGSTAVTQPGKTQETQPPNGDLVPAPTSSPAAPTAAPAAPPATISCSAPNTTCVTSDSREVLKISEPGVYDGQRHTVAGIRVEADNVTVRNFVVKGAVGTGIWSAGENNVITGNDISQVSYGGDDVDAIRFFGNGVKITNNKIHDLTVGDVGDSHVDCMQTWASANTRSSSNITISGNDCRGQDLHQCVMAEGPKSTDGGGGGPGKSSDWLIERNYFACYANQTIALRDIQNVVIRNNEFAGKGNKAIQVTDGSTIKTEGNVLGSGYGNLSGG